KIGTVERVTHFQTKRVARTEATRLEAEILSFFEHEIPKLRGVTGAKENLNAVFAGVTGPRHRDRHSSELKVDNMITRWKIDEELGNTRPLNRDPTKMSATISETDIVYTMSI